MRGRQVGTVFGVVVAAAVVVLTLVLLTGGLTASGGNGDGPRTTQTDPPPPDVASPSGMRAVSAPVPGPVSCPAGPDRLDRLAGTDRVGTAVAVSDALWSRADEVVLASAADYPDALAATGLAADRDAPILLTWPDRLPQRVAGALDRLQPSRVTIVGGSRAVSADVADAVRARTSQPEVTRLAGADRYATAVAVARAAGPARDGAVALASGAAFPDALAAGALAAVDDRVPTLLTPPDRLPSSVADALEELSGGQVLVVGGEAAVSPAVVDAVEARGLSVRRLAGSERYGTAVAVGREARQRALRAPQTPVLASGARFADALAAGAAAARTGGLLLLTPAEWPGDHAGLTGLLGQLRGLDGCDLLVGGTAAVRSDAGRQLAEALDDDPPEAYAQLVGAGDIASCASQGDEATAGLLDRLGGTVATFGDNVYDSGTARQFADCYDPTWGRHRDRTRPVPGNHDYVTDRAAPYYDYFGDAAGPAGKGWYSYDLGAWHVVALNSNCWAVGGCGTGSPQEQWLADDLAAHPGQPVVAYWHHPRFSSGLHASSSAVAALWADLDAAGGQIVLAGHDHTYERFRPADADGNATPDGIREFVVGTGGRSHYHFQQAPTHLTEVRDDTTDGVIVLRLYPHEYAWEFLPAADGHFTDRGIQRTP